ncbi:FAD-binding oxidoreductase [Brucella anthropi]|uniref:FAD-binding oxidoreductase n=1 Tax=Brucella anthropi TaxID=529 RepID=UPI00124DFE98|nr:FAD-binding oxidoreductase [Brucella anthropi]KAB2792782.1 FAD-binding oxidoreductase [Brucella anthropi]QOD65630.1 FAD-binding oxidoreductase [Ochrobactrum sp. MT180101]
MYGSGDMTGNKQADLVALLGVDLVMTGKNDMLGYCRDWPGDVENTAVAVIRPRSTADVSAAVKACYSLGLSIIPQGGNTGLVQGGVPDGRDNLVILSLERMNHIRKIDPDDFSAVVDAGCILSELKDKLAAEGMFFPLALGAQGSCRIGGNVSTNAGGINVLRYGMTRELVLGLEVVLPDGTIFNGLSTLRKDNRGIDLKQLFIGAEGILGVVTGVAIKLMPLPDKVETALLGLNSLDDVIALYRRARVQCCDLMSAFEFMPPVAFTLAQEAMPELAMPLGQYPAYVLMEVSGSGLVDILSLMEQFLVGAMEDGLVLDGTIASSRAQGQNLWTFREAMNEGQALRGKHLRTDISVPLSKLASFVGEAERELTKVLPDCLAVSYGHVGDGNVHLNVIPESNLDVATKDMKITLAKETINAVLDRYAGSISAEHGIGRLKREDFEKRIDPARRKLLEGIKQIIDPDNVMNPGCQLSLDSSKG